MANTVTPDGIRIRKLRIRRGWTQEQLAEIAGVSTRSIQRAERGSAASLETLRALAGAFEIEIAELLAAEANGAASAQTFMTIPPISAPTRRRAFTRNAPGSTWKPAGTGRWNGAPRPPPASHPGGLQGPLSGIRAPPASAADSRTGRRRMSCGSRSWPGPPARSGLSW